MANPINDFPKIGIIAVGGGALRIADQICKNLPDGCDLLLLDTDARELSRYSHLDSIRIGRSLLKGLGCGGDASLGKLALQSDRPRIIEFLKDKELLVLLGCLGKGCATGALPEITAMAGEARVPCFSLVSLPFGFEGKTPARIAREAVVQMRKSADAVVELPNDLLLQQIGDSDRADELFNVSDEWINQAIRSVIGPFHRPGLMSVDLATFRSALVGSESRTLYGVVRIPADSSEDLILRELLRCPLLPSAAGRIEADQLLISIGSNGDLTSERFAQLTYKLSEGFKARKKTVCGVWSDASLGTQIEISVFARTALGQNEIPSRSDPTPVHDSKLGPRKKNKTTERTQFEFEELIEHNERGGFTSNDVEEYAGFDLDKPTFIRKGIKIQLPKL